MLGYKAVLPGLLCGGAVCISVVPGGVQAASWDGALDVPLTLEHDSNPRLESGRHEGVARGTLAPDYRLSGVQGLDTWRFGLGALVLRSSDQNVLSDREDPRLSLGWERETETGALGTSFRYEESSTLGALDETGVETSDGTRKKQSLDSFWRHRVSARSSLSTTLTASDIKYSDTTLDDYQNVDLAISGEHELSERLTPFTRFSVSRYLPADESAQEATTKYQPDAGVRMALSERWELEVHGGRDYVSDGAYSGGWQGGSSLNYLGERMQASFGGERTASSSGEGGFIKVEQLHGSWSYALSELSSIGLAATWRDSQGDRPNVYEQYDAWLSRELGRDWQARFSMAYKKRSQDDAGDATARVFGLTLIYSHPEL